MVLLMLFAFLFLCVGTFAHETEHSENHFYCRVCGSIIANSTSLISKEAEGVHVRGQLENQDGDAVIWFDSFDSSDIWKGKSLVYFNNISSDVIIQDGSQKCPQFPGHRYSDITCGKCKHHLGYMIMKEVEEDEWEEEESTSDMEEDDIASMFPFPKEELDAHLDSLFASIPAPVRSLGYWNYRYHHKKHIEQFHTKTAGVSQDVNLNWSLGSFDRENSGFYAIDTSVSPPKPYYYYIYSNGQHCEETNAPRQTEVRFEACNMKLTVQFKSLQEVSVCKYVATFCVPSLELPKKALYRKEAFYALGADAVVASSDRNLRELLNTDIFGQSVTESEL